MSQSAQVDISALQTPYKTHTYYLSSRNPPRINASPHAMTNSDISAVSLSVARMQRRHGLRNGLLRAHLR